MLSELANFHVMLRLLAAAYGAFLLALYFRKPRRLGYGTSDVSYLEPRLRVSRVVGFGVFGFEIDIYAALRQVSVP